MALRTNKVLVKEVLGAQYDETRCDDLKPFIATANGRVNWLADVCDEDSLNDATQLELIERWLAAHFYGVMIQLLTSKSQGGSSGSFQGQTGKYFEATIFGQMAIANDLSGCLLKLQAELVQGGKKVAGVAWMGKTKPNQLSADERNA